jgi:phosphatidylglycerophosphate synthase
MNGGRVQAVQTPVLPTMVRGPANQVTLTRAVLSIAVALMVALSSVAAVPVALLVGTTTVALALDWVDGQVARRTGTVTAFGARFDMEVDAFLILVLSVYVARSFGVWVLAIGLARYVLLSAERVWPWLHRQVPPRYWRKVVAAIQGIVLTVAASGLLPHQLVAAALVGALLLLAESFGRDVVWLSTQ